MSRNISGKIHSIQTLGTVDGPGVRFVVFMQGCNLRCRCCHNPDTWQKDGGTVYTAEELAKKVLSYKSYFGKDGGITVSGGEPLLQSEFVCELFRLCHANDINTCLDTSGCILSNSTKDLLSHTDRVLLDIKYVSDRLYRENVGISIKTPLDFLGYLDSKKIPVTIRQVIISGINDTPAAISALKKMVCSYECVDKIELLPFRKICSTKYDALKIDFPFSHIAETSTDTIDKLNKIISEYI